PDADDQVYRHAAHAAASLSGHRLFGGAGNDALFAYAAGTSAVELNLPGDELHGGDSKDSLNGNIRKEKLFGDAGQDLIFGDILVGPLYANNPQAATFGAADQLFGGTDEDQLFGGGGADVAF